MAAVEANDGVITRREALRVVEHHVLDRAVRAGVLRRAHSGVYVHTGLSDDCHALDRAALAYAPFGALSHTTGLRIWELRGKALDDRRHVTTGSRPQRRGDRRLFVHRRQWFAPVAPFTTVRNGLRVVRIEQAIIESWPLLHPADRRAPAIDAVNSRRTTPQRLIDVLRCQPGTEGVAQLGALFTMLARGCRSELEIWGHRRVFDDASLPPARLQHRVSTAAGTYYLDRAYLEELVDVEIDGAAWHDGAGRREADVRRDAALAAAGWLVVRFTHTRLHTDPRGCRDELRGILAARRRQAAAS